MNDSIGFESLLRVGETRADRKGTAWPLDVAVQHAQVDMVQLLLAKGAKFHGQEMAQAAFARIPKQSLAMITALLKAGAVPASLACEGRGTVSVAAKSLTGAVC